MSHRSRAQSPHGTFSLFLTALQAIFFACPRFLPHAAHHRYCSTFLHLPPCPLGQGGALAGPAERLSAPRNLWHIVSVIIYFSIAAVAAWAACAEAGVGCQRLKPPAFHFPGASAISIRPQGLLQPWAHQELPLPRKQGAREGPGSES